MARRQITAQQIEDLYIDTMGGDKEAEKELRDLIRRLSKRANQQMLEQERRDVRGEAYRRAQAFLDGDIFGENERGARFTENANKLHLHELRAQADALLSFTSARDYSIPYAIKSAEEIDKMSAALASAGVDIEDQRVAFWMNELFKTGAWKEFKKAHGRSTNLIQAAQEQFQAGKTVDDLLSAYNDYQSNRDDAPEDLVQTWNRFAPGTW